MQPPLPIYCETAHPMSFGSIVIAEPVNFFTNFFILFAALAATRLLLRRRSVTAGQWLLVILLFMTAFGSFAWHGVRTPLTLAMDGWSGVAFLIVLIGVWIEGLCGRWVGIFGALGFVVLAVGSFIAGVHGAMMVGGEIARRFIFVPFFVLVTACGLMLIAATGRRNAAAARIGVYALICGLIAAVGRSVDLFTCSWIPFGSHFLWHMFLSLAAYLALVMVTELTRPGGWARG